MCEAIKMKNEDPGFDRALSFIFFHAKMARYCAGIGQLQLRMYTSQSEIYRRGNVENGWKSLIMVDHAWKCQ